MTDHQENQPAGKKVSDDDRQSNWGIKLFMATLFTILVFFWWLLIYSGGVTVHHG